MKISDLAFVLNKLNENGYGDVELYTHWEDYKGKPKYPEFHMISCTILEKCLILIKI